tara:strand:+ start:199 stop:507 length:309 start_codon:yes stop_codon:yes gene_type:complete
MCKILGIMIIKKITLGLSILGLLNGCIQNSALVGPIYAIGSTGNVYQAGLSLGTNKAITSVTGKSPLENVDNLLKAKKQDSMLRKLVKKQIKETRKKLKFTK